MRAVALKKDEIICADVSSGKLTREGFGELRLSGAYKSLDTD